MTDKNTCKAQIFQSHRLLLEASTIDTDIIKIIALLVALQPVQNVF